MKVKGYDICPTADLQDANLQGADLQDADLQDADLQDADLQGANLQGANLRGADLRNVNLWGTNLQGADLQDADLQGANLQGANLQGANLQGANLRGADLRNVNLKKARLPSPARVLEAHWGGLSPQLTGDLMVYDSRHHPNPKAFQKWADGGPCPYGDCRVERPASFWENKDYWKRGRVRSPYRLMARVLTEKAKEW